MNDKFFNGKLPTGLRFQISSSPRGRFVGQASYRYNRSTEQVWATAVELNGSRTLTLHEWLEVVLHEMIHVLDYVSNPHHFTGYMRRSYDAHGLWFMEEGEKYEKYGFHVQKYCNADIGINMDDNRVKSRINNSVFLYMIGDDGKKYIMKMSRKNLNQNIDYITQRIGRGFAPGVNEIFVLTSNNPNISMLRDLRMRDSTSRISWWWLTDDFKKKYGPFEEEDCIKVLSARKRVAEDGDEEPVEEEPPIEEVADEIEDNIEGVVDVEPVSNDKVEVTIA